MNREVRTHKILVVDDSEVMLTRVRRALVAEGYEVVTTTQAVGNARYLPTCDLVVLDYHMPGLDGRAVLESLKRVARSTPNTCRFYLYTSDAALNARAAELGFDGALTGKGDLEALVQQLRALFRTWSIQKLRARPRAAG